MADFLTNLWTSVFTPGPTPTLLVATNVTFAALQLLLGALFVATYSIHFAILSILTLALWYSINWFAAELIAAQAKEAEADRLRKQRKPVVKPETEWKTKGEMGDSADDEGEDTETEGQGIGESTDSLASKPIGEGQRLKDGVFDTSRASAHTVQTEGGIATGAENAVGQSTSRQRRVEDDTPSGGEISTDSEWEKVESSR